MLDAVAFRVGGGCAALAWCGEGFNAVHVAREAAGERLVHILEAHQLEFLLGVAGLGAATKGLPRLNLFAAQVADDSLHLVGNNSLKLFEKTLTSRPFQKVLHVSGARAGVSGQNAAELVAFDAL